jgi:putative two-component system response regulator
MEYGNVLVVDDSPSVVAQITAMLKGAGYKVRSAPTGEEGLAAAAACPPDLVLLDVGMPGMNGYQVCKQLKAQAGTREVPVIFVTAMSDTDDKVRGFDLGAVDYMTKPFQREELLVRVRTHLDLYRLRYHLERAVEERTAELRASEGKLHSSLLDAVAVLAAAAELRDPYTAGHMRRVAQIASAIARELRLPDVQAEGLYVAALVHDIGKIKVPLEILDKEGPLTGAELSQLQDHVNAGYEILSAIDFPWPVASIVRQHHEFLDGSGFPLGLKGDGILKEAKILAVADTVDGLMSGRPWRPGMSIEAVLDLLTARRGVQFWESAVDACVRVFREQGWRPAV